MNQFLHIAFKWSGQPKIKELEPVFNKAVDWLRYAPNCWIVWTSSDVQKWKERLKPCLGEHDYMFICELNINNRQGWLPLWMWSWINKKQK